MMANIFAATDHKLFLVLSAVFFFYGRSILGMEHNFESSSLRPQLRTPNNHGRPRETSTTIGNNPSCQILPNDSSILSQFTCYEAVQYSFYVPPGLSSSDLDVRARTHLSNDKYQLLPDKCITSIKAATCATVYLRCQDTLGDDIDSITKVTNYSATTFNEKFLLTDLGYLEVAASVPFRRPCMGLCSEVQRNCGDWLRIFNLTSWLNCGSLRRDYNSSSLYQNSSDIYSFPVAQSYSEQNPLLFDSSNNSTSTCQTVTENSTSSIAGSRWERYIHAADSTGVCSGVITETYIPLVYYNQSGIPAAPMRASHAVQKVIESELSAVFKQIPDWTSEACYVSLRKYFCTSAFIQPKATLLKSSLSDSGADLDTVKTIWQNDLGVPEANVSKLLSRTYYAPSYPSEDICLDYVAHCGGFADRLYGVKGISDFLPQCNATTQRYLNNGDEFTVEKFPAGQQTVMKMHVPWMATVTDGYSDYLSVMTTPFKASSLPSTKKILGGFTTSCPRGFVVPEEKTHPRTVWEEGTGCAQSCRLGIYDEEEYATLDRAVRICPSISFPMILIVTLYWISNSTRRKDYYLLTHYMYVTTAFTATFLVQATLIKSAKDRFCVNNAVQRTQADGASLCSVTAIVIVYFSLAGSYAWMFQSIDLFLKICMTKKLKRSREENWRVYAFHMLFIYGFPIVTVAGPIKSGAFGYSGSHAWCSYRYGVSAKVNLYSNHLPALASLLIGGVCLVSVLVVLSILVFCGTSRRRRRKTRKTTNPLLIGGGAVAGGGGIGSVVPDTVGAPSGLVRSSTSSTGNLHHGLIANAGSKNASAVTSPRPAADVGNRAAVAAVRPPERALAAGAAGATGAAGAAGPDKNRDEFALQQDSSRWDLFPVGRQAKSVTPDAEALEAASAFNVSSTNDTSGAAATLDRNNDNNDRHRPPRWRELYSGCIWYMKHPLIRSNAAILVFTVVHLTAWLMLLGFRAVIFFNQKRAENAYEDWVECIFYYFSSDSSQSSEWLEKCGKFPSYRTPFGPTLMAFTASTLYGALISVMHFSSMARLFCCYRGCSYRFFRYVFRKTKRYALCCCNVVVQLLIFCIVSLCFDADDRQPNQQTNPNPADRQRNPANRSRPANDPGNNGPRPANNPSNNPRNGPRPLNAVHPGNGARATAGNTAQKNANSGGGGTLSATQVAPGGAMRGRGAAGRSQGPGGGRGRGQGRGQGQVQGQGQGQGRGRGPRSEQITR